MTEPADDLSGIICGLNMLGEELYASTVSRDYVDNIIKSMIDMLIVVNPDTSIQMVNQATLALLAYEEKELIGKPIRIIFDEEEEFKRSGIEDLIQKGSIRNIEKTFVRKDGRKIPILFSGSVMRDNEGQIQGIVCVARDLTERNRVKDELQKYRAHLEELVEARTSELEMINAQLQQEITERRRAEEELRALERRQMEAEKIIALGQVAAGVAHEINNPLASLTNCFHIVKGALPQRHGIEQFVRFIDRDLERIAAIVRAMYNLYQPPHAVDSPISINEVLSDVLAAMEGAMSASAVELQDERYAGDLEVNLPAGQMAQIFTNIFNNALDAMPEGGQLRVKTGKPDERVVVEITDTGEGIPPDVLPHIFEPFFTTKSTADGKETRMGLGLSITQSLVNSLGGHLKVKTELGAGTCFLVSLPIKPHTESEGEISHE